MDLEAMDRAVALKNVEDRRQQKRFISSKDLRLFGRELDLSWFTRIISLDLSGMNLSVVRCLPPSLEIINLHGNSLKHIEVNGLIHLRIAILSKNCFESIPDFHQCCLLLSLNMNQNKMDTLHFERLPMQLEELYVNQNKISILPSMSHLCMLQDFSCDRNRIKVIMSLPQSLEWLSCTCNQLQAFDCILPYIRFLDLSDNSNLRSLAPLSQSIQYLFLHFCSVPFLDIRHCYHLKYMGYNSRIWPSMLLPNSLEQLEITQCHSFEIPKSMKTIITQPDNAQKIMDSAFHHSCHYVDSHIYLSPIDEDLMDIETSDSVLGIRKCFEYTDQKKSTKRMCS